MSSLFPPARRTWWRFLLASVAVALLIACHPRPANVSPAIRFTRVPVASDDSGAEHDFIGGKAIGAQQGQQIVLYAKSAHWWLQPLVKAPFTRLQPNSQWVNSTHLGSSYAALLVDPGYIPPAEIDQLPMAGGLVAAVAVVPGAKNPPSPMLEFSGYRWIVRDGPSNRGGHLNLYEPANAWTDAKGALHLRMLQRSGEWSCAEVSLTQSLGFGTYLFSVRDISGLEPAAVFGIFTWDWAAPDQNYSEVSIEMSRWGDPSSKNGQYVVQPFYVPANVFRFATPAETITHSIQWEPGHVTFQSRAASGRVLAEHDFTSGIPSPGIESLRMNLYAYQGGKQPPRKAAEVIVEKFQYLP